MKNPLHDRAIAPVFQPALDALTLGLCPVPPKMDGSKAPIGQWKQFQQTRPDESQIRAWYKSGECTGYGLITGAISRNLELFEFDCPITYQEFKSAADAAGLSDLVHRIEAGYCETTPGAGVHWFYFCTEIDRNTKLATRPKTPEEKKNPKDKVQVLIETRGEGGFAIIAPSNGKTHPTGGCYSLVSGSLATIITITPEERRDLHGLARSFTVAPDAATPRPATPADKSDGWKIRPGDDFNSRADWRELLEAQGWTFVYRRGEADYWRRPGKNQGVSACTGWQGKGYFYCWSSSTEFEAEKPLDKVGFHARTMHGGDFKATVKALAQGGYGTPADDRKPSAKPKATGPAPADQQGDALHGFPDGHDDLLVEGNKLRKHNDAAALLFEKEFGGRLFYDPIQLDWFEYQPGAGVFDKRPALAIEKAVYQAINHHRGELGFDASYVAGVTKCLLYEAVAQPKPVVGKICFTNGVLDLATRELLPHSPDFYFTSSLPFAWNPDAPDPELFITWLRAAVGGHDDQVQLLRAYLNAVVVGRPELQRFLELVGAAGSGKGTFIRTAQALVGKGGSHPTRLKELEENRFETANLLGKRLVVIGDAEKWNGSIDVLKSITGQDSIRFEQKHKQGGEDFTFGGMVIIAGNQHTNSTDYSSGIQRRKITVPFDHVVPASERRELDVEFEPLLPAILKWALDMPQTEVTARLRNTGAYTASLKAARMEALAATNPLAAWMLDNVHFAENVMAQVGEKKRLTISVKSCYGETVTRVAYEYEDTRLYPNYCRWCDQNSKMPVSKNLFSSTVIDVAKNLLSKEYVKSKHTRAGRYIFGMTLTQPNPRPPKSPDDDLVTTCDDLVTTCDDLVTTQVIDCDEGIYLEPFYEVNNSVEENAEQRGITRAVCEAEEKNFSRDSGEQGGENALGHHLHHNQQVRSSQGHHKVVTGSSQDHQTDAIDRALAAAATSKPMKRRDLARIAGYPALADLDSRINRLLAAGYLGSLSGGLVAGSNAP